MQNIIDVNNLTKRFADKIAVDHISLTVKQGDVYGFLGPNGSGKTTTMRMLCGLLVPDAGEGTCLGFDVLKDSQRIKIQVGYMTQKFSLYENLTVKENLNFAARIFAVSDYKKKVQQHLEQFNLGSERENQLAGVLSGGWKQRLALACATIHEPKLLLLDEPTAGVDPKARRDFWEEIHTLAAKGVTTLVSTHYMDEAERCNRLAYIANGKVLTTGTAAEIIAGTGFKTFEVNAPSLHALNQLATELKKNSLLDVTSFGQKLHVNTQTAINVGSLLKQLVGTEYNCKQIEPTLEDVFIYLMREQGRRK